SHDIRGVLAYLFCAASHAGMGGQLLDALDKAGILLAGDPGITKDVTRDTNFSTWPSRQCAHNLLTV
ncbi:MAG: hypothetical protein Q8R69_02980, partial [Telluria sp.]|nr:hypothetical protein [Telluria sp.]